jgi:hypothetical protein
MGSKGRGFFQSFFLFSFGLGGEGEPGLAICVFFVTAFFWERGWVFFLCTKCAYLLDGMECEGFCFFLFFCFFLLCGDKGGFSFSSSVCSTYLLLSGVG